MALDQPFGVFLSGNYAPVRDELDVQLEVRGELPAGLVGSLYRNGPNPQFDPQGPHHWFHGDGMVHAFHIDGDRARYSNRFVQTPKWAAEKAAGHALAPEVWSAQSNMGVANTNILWHGERLLALEEMHGPFEVDAASLAPRGGRDWGGPVTAHPKIDPQTGEMVFFAFSADGPLSPTVHYGVADSCGTVLRREAFQAPYCSMMHDFIVTRDHVLFPVLPLSGDMQRAMAGGPAYAWDPGKGGFVGVMKRNGSVDDIRWFNVEPQYVYHVMNAYDVEGAIVADVMAFETAPLFPDVDGTFRPTPVARLTRWTFDLIAPTNDIRQTLLDDMPGEFPRFDERRSGLSYRHGWFAAARQPMGPIWHDSLAHIDLATGRRTMWELPSGDALSEPVFIPRAPDAEEGDGWITTVVYRGRDDTSELAILDARDVARGPIATARTPRRVPFGFHGNWRAGALA